MKKSTLPSGNKPIYSYPEVSSKFGTLERIRDNKKIETYYASVRYDAIKEK